MKIRRKLKHTRPTPEGGYLTQELEVEVSPEEVGILDLRTGDAPLNQAQMVARQDSDVMVKCDNIVMRFIAKRMPGAFDVEALRKLLAEKEALGL